MSKETRDFAWNGEDNQSDWFKRLIQAALGEPPNPVALKELAIWVFQKAHAMIGQRADLDPEAIAQDCLIKIWKKRKAISGYENPLGYCLQVARTTILDQLRYKGRHPSSSTTSTVGEEEVDLLDVTPDPDANPAETLILKEFRECLEMAIETKLELYPNQRDAEYFRLHYFKKMEITIIASMFQVDRNRVDVGISRVRAWLRDNPPDISRCVGDN